MTPPFGTSKTAIGKDPVCAGIDLRQPPVLGIPSVAPDRACGAVCVWRICKLGELYLSSPENVNSDARWVVRDGASCRDEGITR